MEAPIPRGIDELPGVTGAWQRGHAARGDFPIETGFAEAERGVGAGEGGDAGTNELTGDRHAEAILQEGRHG